jgi:16S rRNA processing protein RimM
VLAELFTDFPERFEDQRRVFLAAPGFDGDEAKARSAEVMAFWLPVGKNEGRVVLQFAGIDTISDAESIAGLDVLVPREERLPLEDESVYISELVGCTVYDGPTAVGVVEDVQFAMTADGGRRLEDAAPLLAVTSSGGDEILIPFAKAFLVAVDTDAKRIEMTLPEGLIEINRSAGGGGVSKDQKR